MMNDRADRVDVVRGMALAEAAAIAKTRPPAPKSRTISIQSGSSCGYSLARDQVEKVAEAGAPAADSVGRDAPRETAVCAGLLDGLRPCRLIPA